jgi:hypothetical protein
VQLIDPGGLHDQRRGRVDGAGAGAGETNADTDRVD